MPGPYSAAKVKPAVTTVGGGVPYAPHSSTPPHHVIFNARCTRYTMYLNSPAIRLNSTQT